MIITTLCWKLETVMDQNPNFEFNHVTVQGGELEILDLNIPNLFWSKNERSLFSSPVAAENHVLGQDFGPKWWTSLKNYINCKSVTIQVFKSLQRSAEVCQEQLTRFCHQRIQILAVMQAWISKPSLHLTKLLVQTSPFQTSSTYNCNVLKTS